MNNFSPIFYFINSNNNSSDQAVFVQPEIIIKLFGSVKNIRDQIYTINKDDKQAIACLIKNISNTVLGIFQAGIGIRQLSGMLEVLEVMNMKIIFIDNLINTKLNHIMFALTNGMIESDSGQKKIEDLFSPLNQYYYITFQNDTTGQEVKRQAVKYEIGDAFTKMYIAVYQDPTNFMINQKQLDLAIDDLNESMKFIDELISATIFGKGDPEYIKAIDKIFSGVRFNEIPHFDNLKRILNISNKPQ